MKAESTDIGIHHSATLDLPVAGLWIEFLDERGNTLARHVVDEWHDRPVPARGDRFEVSDIIGERCHQGIVVARREELQHTADGEPRLWIQLTVRVTSRPATGVSRLPSLAMSYSKELLGSRN